jgi:hypothetical protein
MAKMLPIHDLAGNLDLTSWFSWSFSGLEDLVSAFAKCLPSGLKALHIGLDAGGRLLVCCRTGEK